jgi:hypothetical protein
MIHIFDRSKKLGASGEKYISRLNPVILSTAITRHIYGSPEGTKYQTKGIDQSTIITKVNIEIKTRNWQFYRALPDTDIVLETIQDIQKNTPGWIYTTNANYVIYQWELYPGTVKTGYIIDMTKFHACRHELFKKFHAARKQVNYSTFHGETVWGSEFFTIKVLEFPEGVLIPLDTETINKIYVTGV